MEISHSLPLFQMSEASLAREAGRHTSHLSSLLSLQLPPQLCLVVGESLARLDRKVGDHPRRGHCGHCHIRRDGARDRLEQVAASRSKPQMERVVCHRCGKVLDTRLVDNSVLDTSDRLVDVSGSVDKVLNKRVMDMNSPRDKGTVSLEGGMKIKTEEVKHKKKRKSKEVNAGLLLPQGKTKLLQTSMKPLTAKVNPMSKNKLKFLMAKAETPKRSGLQDFLKQL